MGGLQVLDDLNDCERVQHTRFDEILLVDSHSTDATREIAGRFEGVQVVSRTYYGAASQKNWAIDRCRHDWILILDADEVFSTGNYGKVLPITRVEDRDYQIGHVYRKARELYFEFARGQTAATEAL